MADDPSSKDPHFTILRIVPSDVSQIHSIVVDSMSSDAMDRELFPAGPDSDSHRRTWGEDLWRRTLQQPHVHLLKAVPTADPTTIAGFACWNHNQPSAPEMTVADAIGNTLPQGMNPALYAEMTSKFDAAKARHLPSGGDKAHWHLTMLGVRPEFQRQGVANLLMRWGVESADAEREVVFLEATPVGLGLYRRFGFEEREWLEFTGGGQRVVMVRPVKGG